MAGIEKVQQIAGEQKASFYEMGVFLFFSDHEGDAWMLELTEADALQIARSGQPLAVAIDENPETIEINFTHTFALRDRQLIVTAYADTSETLLDRAPTQQVHAALRRLHKRYPKEILGRMHVNPSEESAA